MSGRLKVACGVSSPVQHLLCSPRTSDHQAVSPCEPDSRIGAEFFPERPRQQLSHVCAYACSPDLMPVPADFAVREGLAAPSRRPRSRKASCPLMRSNGDLVGSGAAGAGLGGSPPGSASGHFCQGVHRPASLPFQSRSLSPSPLGSSAPSSIPERPSFASQTGHGMWVLSGLQGHLLQSGWVAKTQQRLCRRGRGFGSLGTVLTLSVPHSLPATPRSLSGSQPCGPGLPGCPARGHGLH